MAQMVLHLLGPPRVEIDNEPITINRRKVLALLIYLALTPKIHRRDALAALLWPGYDQTSARANLRRTLSTLNQTLAGEWLQIEREQVALKPGEDVWLDVDEFHRLVSSCATHGHPSSEVCPACLEPLGQAVALYQDDLLSGFTLPDSPEFDDWQLFQTESLRRELAESLEKLVRGHSAQGEFDLAIEFARRWLALDPLQEAAHRQLMRLLTLSGERSAALAQYESCRQILADELGVEPTAETTALYQNIRENKLDRQDDPLAPLSSRSAVPPHKLPAQLTPFIGRAGELAEITRLIREESSCRLLTLVGPGGSGKTRLAIRVAEETGEAFPHGVYFVPLAPIRSAESLAPTIASTLDFPLSGAGNPEDQLLNYLREKELLLVLDNFEPLITEQGTELLLKVLKRAPQVKLLVTSRERLNLKPEWGVDVHGLRFPTVDRAALGRLETYDAVQLFLQQARRARPGFTLSPENAPDIVRICRLVEGMPLGLELAASWLRLMACREISREIERSLDFLTTPLRDLPERHQSLRAVFEHSWQLLSKEEQAVFRKLSVFHGGFRRRAAERVADASLPLLSALGDKSLLRRTRAGRYEIHELLHQFAAEKLSDIPNEVEAAQDRHCNYYATFTQQRADDLKGGRLREALGEIRTEIDNIRAGWHRAVTQRNAAALSKFQESLFSFYEYRGWYQEAEAAFEQAVERLREEDEKIVRAQLLRGQGWFRARLSLKQGIESLKQSVSLLRQVEREPQLELAFSALVLGWATHIWSEFEESERSLKESLAIYTQVSDPWGIGSTLIDLGFLAFYQGEHAVAEQYLQRSIAALNRIGETVNLANALMGQGRLAQIKGEYEQAGRYLRRALRISREFVDPFFTAIALRELGYLAIAQGSYLKAQEYLQESIVICKENGDRRSLINSLDKLGTVTRLRGEYEQAEQLHQECLTLAEEIDYQWNMGLSFNNLGRLAYDQREYRQAERYHREGLAIWEQLGNQREIAATLCHLGYVACALEGDRDEEARRYLHQSLEIAMKIGARPVVLNTLVGWATWLTAGEPNGSAQERVIELLTLALHHPASEQETKDRAKRLLDELASSLPPESLAAAQESGKTRNLETVAAELLIEVETW